VEIHGGAICNADRYHAVTGSQTGVPFEGLERADLTVDTYYMGGRTISVGSDPIARIVPVGNQGGFRYAGSPRNRTVTLAVLYSSGADPDWPDSLDEQTGAFTYYGDNKKPGRELHDTERGGNILLRDVFERTYGSAADRRKVPPFLLFVKAGSWRDVRFRGLLVPGTASTSSDDDLQAIWRSKDGLRFQNYRARFTVLDVPTVTRLWLDEVLAGDPVGSNAPAAWLQWVAGRAYHALTAQRTTVTRTRDQQLPAAGEGMAMLDLLNRWFEQDPYGFEACAVEIWRMMAANTGRVEITQRSRDGGRDAVGDYLLGPAADRVPVEFVLEAKCYRHTNSVGVREVSRLISRMRHRMFGVFVTTSFYNPQAYDEVRSDGHPLVLISGRDIVDVLGSHGYTTVESVRTWLAQQFPASALS
jgi:hypothetical protein